MCSEQSNTIHKQIHVRMVRIYTENGNRVTWMCSVCMYMNIYGQVSVHLKN